MGEVAFGTALEGCELYQRKLHPNFSRLPPWLQRVDFIILSSSFPSSFVIIHHYCLLTWGGRLSARLLLSCVELPSHACPVYL